MHEKVFTTLDQALRDTETFFEAVEQGAEPVGWDDGVMCASDNCAMLAMRWEPNLMNILGKATMQNLQQSKDEIIREPNSHVMDGHPAQR